jgi:hypothetical protein
MKLKRGKWYWDLNSTHKRAERAFAVLPAGDIATMVAQKERGSNDCHLPLAPIREANDRVSSHEGTLAIPWCP